MVSNHAVWRWKAPVKASVSGVSLLQLSPFFASIFPLFPQKRLILRLEICHFDTPKYKNLVSQVKVKQVFIYGLQLNDNKINILTKNFYFESS